ncbi:uncharacterized protein EAF01_007524 [Botrytis porri]|uniref:uncharacterized protein n=1 Tax=Botrytis porri TaxID=87229 RepID=UPI0018FF3BDE|nr:uncharacterized protein EAF01_007524 [Botrytis porri]KAF7900222.1 hypothetical protein EAF01_007524 [Botrytis porri]
MTPFFRYATRLGVASVPKILELHLMQKPSSSTYQEKKEWKKMKHSTKIEKTTEIPTALRENPIKLTRRIETLDKNTI